MINTRTEDMFYIDADNRDIYIPESFNNSLGVLGDYNAETLVFRMSKYFDNQDLSTKQIYIVYINANNEGYFHKCDVVEPEVVIGDDEFCFAWKLNWTVFKAPGKVHFNVKIFDNVEDITTYAEDGDSTQTEVNYVFNTKVCCLDVAEGIDLESATGSFDEADTSLTDINMAAASILENWYEIEKISDNIDEMKQVSTDLQALEKKAEGTIENANIAAGNFDTKVSAAIQDIEGRADTVEKQLKIWVNGGQESPDAEDIQKIDPDDQKSAKYWASFAKQHTGEAATQNYVDNAVKPFSDFLGTNEDQITLTDLTSQLDNLSEKDIVLQTNINNIYNNEGQIEKEYIGNKVLGSLEPLQSGAFKYAKIRSIFGMSTPSHSGYVNPLNHVTYRKILAYDDSNSIIPVGGWRLDLPDLRSVSGNYDELTNHGLIRRTNIINAANKNIVFKNFKKTPQPSSIQIDIELRDSSLEYYHEGVSFVSRMSSTSDPSLTFSLLTEDSAQAEYPIIRVYSSSGRWNTTNQDKFQRDLYESKIAYPCNETIDTNYSLPTEFEMLIDKNTLAGFTNDDEDQKEAFCCNIEYYKDMDFNLISENFLKNDENWIRVGGFEKTESGTTEYTTDINLWVNNKHTKEHPRWTELKIELHPAGNESRVLGQLILSKKNFWDMINLKDIKPYGFHQFLYKSDIDNVFRSAGINYKKVETEGCKYICSLSLAGPSNVFLYVK